MENNEQNTTAQETPVFGIEKLYVRDLSVEVPNAPEIFLEQDSPQVEIGLNTSGRGVADGVFEVVLTVTVTAKLGDKTVLDVLDPIAVSLEGSAAAGEPLGAALAKATKAAEAALEATKLLVAQHGKAAAFQEKSRGLQDAGATVACFIITTMSTFVNAA